MTGNTPYILGLNVGAMSCGRGRYVSAVMMCCFVLAMASCQANATFAPSLDAEPSAVLTCVPNLDGMITAAEQPIQFGVPGQFRVSPKNQQVSVSTAGEDDGDGVRTWRWDGDEPSDELVDVAPHKLTDQWFVSTFPDGQFTAPLNRDASQVGIYRKDDQALWLLGFASEQATPASKRTLARYNTPVAVFRYPIRAGRSWVSTAKLSGAVVSGLPFAGVHTYEVEVDGAGRAIVPAVSFEPALRVRTRFTNRPLIGPSTTSHQVSLVFECFGEVARIVSDGGEDGTGHTTGELWRFHP